MSSRFSKLGARASSSVAQLRLVRLKLGEERVERAAAWAADVEVVDAHVVDAPGGRLGFVRLELEF